MDDNQIEHLKAIEDKVERFGINLEFLILAMKGNHMNPLDNGIVGDIKNVKEDLRDFSNRLSNVETQIIRAKQTYITITVVCSILGTIIGIAIAIFGILKK